MGFQRVEFETCPLAQLQDKHERIAAYTGLFNLLRTLQQQDAPKTEIFATETMLEDWLGWSEEYGTPYEIARFLVSLGVIRSRTEVYSRISKFYNRFDSQLPESEPRQTPIIGIVGQISAGKGTVGEIISKQIGSMHFPLSDRLREVAHINSQPPFERNTLRQVNDKIKPRFGQHTFVE